MLEVRFSNGFLNHRQQQLLKEGFERHTRDVSAPDYQKNRVNWKVYENTERLVGTLTADLLWDWIYIDELWVDENYRRSGVASMLMKTAENFAASHDMTGLWLWTQSWQASEFYEKLGYIEFTRFDDFPKGHQRIGFRKQVRVDTK